MLRPVKFLTGLYDFRFSDAFFGINILRFIIYKNVMNCMILKLFFYVLKGYEHFYQKSAKLSHLRMKAVETRNNLQRIKQKDSDFLHSIFKWKNLTFVGLTLLLLQAMLEGHEAGSLNPVNLLVVQDADHGLGVHGLSWTQHISVNSCIMYMLQKKIHDYLKHLIMLLVTII